MEIQIIEYDIISGDKYSQISVGTGKQNIHQSAPQYKSTPAPVVSANVKGIKDSDKVK